MTTDYELCHGAEAKCVGSVQMRCLGRSNGLGVFLFCSRPSELS